MSILDKIFGDPNEKVVKGLHPIVDQINALEAEIVKLSDSELRTKTNVFKEIITKRLADIPADASKEELRKAEEDVLGELLPEAFAVIREASKRVLGMRHFDVQLIGGIVLHHGQIAEMRTGEGKTLVATLPLYLNALLGKGVHLVTVNDYLSRIGAGWMGRLYDFLGLSTGVIVHDAAYVYDSGYTDEAQFDSRLNNFRPVPRKEAYACDILYGTNNEYGFDYLRDNMAPRLEAMVQRDLHYAIVDEVDSILIDEARTPLIISAPAEESTDKYYKFAQLVRNLKESDDYNIDEKMRAVTLTEGGISKMEKLLGVENIYTSGGVREVHHIEQSLKAEYLFKKDKDYVVKDGEVVIVDEFTGRLMHGRRYSEGLHQAIEAKEGVKIQRESMTLATITFQNYFRLFNKLGGMTGTAVTEAEEFAKIYELDTVVIPTNKPMVRKDMNDLIYRTENGKFMAVVQETKKRHEAGQPVLIGTISIERNEMLAEMMEREGLRPQVLNAKQHDKEARIISEAGKPGAITIATNMAGRGVDIMLGGKEPEKDDSEYTEWQEGRKQVIEAGGLHVIGTERHESRRIDNQLRGRAGRQGDPGSSQFYVSTDDDLMRIFGGERMKNLMATLKLPEDMPIENRLITKSIESAQRKVEGHNFDIRKHLVEYDDVINKHREAIYKRRREVLDIAEGAKREVEQPESASYDLSAIILEMIEAEIEQVVSFHTAAEDIKEWDLDEIYQVVSTIFPVESKLKDNLSDLAGDNQKLDKVKARTAIIEHLVGLAKDNYAKIEEQAARAGVDWIDLEKSVLIRSIDTLWIEHLEAMDSMRQGIGLRGYGQRDPLVEYKKEAYKLFTELNAYIQKEVVYSIFKIGGVQTILAPNLSEMAREFNAPAKEMERGSSFAGMKATPTERENASRNRVDLVKPKTKDDEGHKVGRNDLCPCGSGKKYKKCCGK